jgi:hypothetical protein
MSDACTVEPEASAESTPVAKTSRALKLRVMKEGWNKAVYLHSDGNEIGNKDGNLNVP